MLKVNNLIGFGRRSGFVPGSPVSAVLYKGENNLLETLVGAHATAGGSLAYTTGFDGVNTAFSFPGGTGGLTTARVLTPTLNVGSNYTLGFWLYKTSAADYSLVVNDFLTNSHFGGFYIDGSTQTPRYWFDNVRRVTSVIAVANTTWTYVSVAYNGSKSTIFLNNMRTAEESGTHAETFNNAVGFGIGISNIGGDFPLNGRLDEVSIINTAQAGDALVAHYAGESNVNDSAAFSRTATAGAGTAYGTGQDGVHSAFSFNGNANSRVLVPTLHLLPNYSIEFYFKTSSTASFQHLITNSWNGSGTFGALYCTSGSKISYWQGSALKVETAAAAVSTGTWYKVKLTYDGSKSRIYINDVLAATESSTHSETFSGQCGIGYPSGTAESNALTGLIDEVKFYNYLV